MIQQEGNMTAQDEEDDETEHEKDERHIRNSTNETAFVSIKFVEGDKKARGEQEEGR